MSAAAKAGPARVRSRSATGWYRRTRGPNIRRPRWPHPGRAARVQDRFADAAGVTATVLGLVSDDAAVQFSAAEVAWVEDPVAGRVVLIGDAWHATTPNMAQGGSMAAEDALVLARELGRDPRGLSR